MLDWLAERLLAPPGPLLDFKKISAKQDFKRFLFFLALNLHLKKCEIKAKVLYEKLKVHER